MLIAISNFPHYSVKTAWIQEIYHYKIIIFKQVISIFILTQNPI